MSTHRETNHAPGFNHRTRQGSKEIAFEDVNKKRDCLGRAVKEGPHVLGVCWVGMATLLPCKIGQAVQLPSSMVGLVKRNDNQVSLSTALLVQRAQCLGNMLYARLLFCLFGGKSFMSGTIVFLSMYVPSLP